MNKKDVALYTSMGILAIECCVILWIFYKKEKVLDEKPSDEKP